MRTGAIAKTVYVDPSAPLKLYIHERESTAMNAWRLRTKWPLAITHHCRVEIINVICLAGFRGFITAEAMNDSLESFDEDFAQGMYVQADLPWRSALNRATELSREHTPSLGCRSLDILHVASALELALPNFLTFDLRQKKLAKAVGMKVIVP